MHARYAKIAMTLSLAAFALLVAFSNVTDYGANYPFVQHVLSMDTTFKDPAVIYRAITAPWAWTAAYWLIIIGEAATGVLFAVAGWRMLAAREQAAPVFAGRRRWCIRPPQSGSWSGSSASWWWAASGS